MRFGWEEMGDLYRSGQKRRLPGHMITFDYLAIFCDDIKSGLFSSVENP